MSSVFNEYISDDEKYEKEITDSEYDLTSLKVRLNGVKSLSEIKNEVEIFLQKNNVSDKVKDELVRTVDNFSENTSIYDAVYYLEEVIQKEIEETEKDKKQNHEDMVDYVEDEISQDFRELQLLGIDLVEAKEIADKIVAENADNYDEIIDDLSRSTDLIHDNLKDFSIEETPNISLSAEELIDATLGNGDNSLYDEVISQQEEQLDTANSSLISVNDDGTVIVDGDFINDPEMQFASMMVSTILLDQVANGLSMQILKGQNEENSYKVLFNLSQIPNQELYISQLKDKINFAKSNFNPIMDYRKFLSTRVPEIGMSMDIAKQNMSETKGAFSLNITNGSVGPYDVMFSMDSNYSKLFEAFRESGAPVFINPNETLGVNLSSINSAAQTSILRATYENIEELKRQEEIMKQDSLAKQKTLGKMPMPNSIAGNISGNILILVVLAEIVALTIGAYFIFR